MIITIIIKKDIIAPFLDSSSLNAITLTALLNLSLMKNTVKAIAINKTNVFIFLIFKVWCAAAHTTYFRTDALPNVLYTQHR